MPNKLTCGNEILHQAVQFKTKQNQPKNQTHTPPKRQKQNFPIIHFLLIELAGWAAEYV